MITRRATLSGLAIFSVLATSSAWAQGMPTPTLALQGYDPVAYFTDGRPVLGSTAYEIAWDGQRYLFASARHRDMFTANPDKYAPQFGGLCAMNMSAGVRRESDPHNWVISNGNLFVFAGVRGKEAFAKDVATNAAKATSNWKTLKPTQ